MRTVPSRRGVSCGLARRVNVHAVQAGLRHKWGGSCVACAAGSFTTNYSSVQCTPCALGYVSPVVGAVSPLVCAACDAGKVTNADPAAGVLGTACVDCPPGKYNPTPGYAATACIDYPVGAQRIVDVPQHTSSFPLFLTHSPPPVQACGPTPPLLRRSTPASSAL